MAIISPYDYNCTEHLSLGVTRVGRMEFFSTLVASSSNDGDMINCSELQNHKYHAVSAGVELISAGNDFRGT